MTLHKRVAALEDQVGKLLDCFPRPRVSASIDTAGASIVGYTVTITAHLDGGGQVSSSAKGETEDSAFTAALDSIERIEAERRLRHPRRWSA